jgi:hypothetical protein
MLFLAIAFGERDMTWGLLYAIALYGFLAVDPVFVGGRMLIAVPAVGLIIYLGLTTYGIVSAHLFDIDLKLKWTLERGTVAAAFVAVFFVVSEGVASLLSDQVGSLLGILATGGLVFLLSPLQRAAERFASGAMPTVQDTPEYKRFRKLQIYGEAAAEALRDGPIPPVGRAILNRLREQLELDSDEASALEKDLERRVSEHIETN